jgi:hypothetical protein
MMGQFQARFPERNFRMIAGSTSPISAFARHVNHVFPDVKAKSIYLSTAHLVQEGEGWLCIPLTVGST